MMADEWKEDFNEPDEPVLLINDDDGDGAADAAAAEAAAAAAAAPGGAEVDPSSSLHWTHRLLWGLSLGGSVSALWNGLRYRTARERLQTLAHAPCVTVEQIGAFLDKKQALHALQSSDLSLSSTAASSSSSSVFSPVPPAYVCLVGRSSCASPLLTSFTPTPQPAIWLLHTSVRRCFKLWPLTTLKMFEQQQTESHCENRAFEINAVGTAAAAAAGTGTNAAASAASVPSTAVVPSASFPSVLIPSSLPADSSHLLSLIHQASDVTSDVHLSSSEFMRQLAAGLLHVQERNLERIVPVGYVITAFGWVHKDAQGRISMIGGNEQAKQSLQQALAGGAHTTTPATAAAVASPPTQHDAASDLYSATHPAILSAHPPSRVLDVERAALGSIKTKLLLSAAVALAASLALAAKFLYASYERREQLRRIVFFHQLRKERKEQVRKERRERERRRESKKRARAQAKEQSLRHKAQVAYLQATAAAATAAQPEYVSMPLRPHTPPIQQLEGVPQYGVRSTPSPVRGAAMQHPPQQASRERLPHSPAPLYPVAASSSQSSSSSSSMRTPPSMRAPSPYSASASLAPGEAASSYAPQPPLRRQSSQPAVSSSAASASVVAAHMLGALDPSVDSDEGSVAGVGDASEASDEDSPSAASGAEDGADDCVICAEHKADACLVKCGHMYTCCACARHLSVCPICRSPVERVVKVFAQML